MYSANSNLTAQNGATIMLQDQSEFFRFHGARNDDHGVVASRDDDQVGHGTHIAYVILAFRAECTSYMRF